MLKKIVFLLPFLFAGAVYADDYEYAMLEERERGNDSGYVVIFSGKKNTWIGSDDHVEGKEAYKELFEKAGWKTKEDSPSFLDALNHLGSEGWKVINYSNTSKRNRNVIEVLLIRED